jgi:tellurite resistance protein TerC
MHTVEIGAIPAKICRASGCCRAEYDAPDRIAPMNELPLWIGFNVFVVLLIVLDLFVLGRKSHVIGLREAGLMSAFWIGMALLVNVFIWWYLGRSAGVAYFTGWLLEKSLSVDNLFVILVIFSYFKVPAQYQRRVLQWGIIGALIMRAIFIVLGSAILSVFHPIIYLFGAFLVYTGIRLARNDSEEAADLHDNAAVKLIKRFMPVTADYHDEKFTIIEAGKRIATPLLLVLGVVETTDLLFAVDSIPAVLGVTRDSFIVYASNAMAILGLRALYFLLAGVMDRFHLLKYALSAILVFVGLKMLTEDWLLEGVFHISKETLVVVTLVFIVGALTLAIVASLRRPAAAASADH